MSDTQVVYFRTQEEFGYIVEIIVPPIFDTYEYFNSCRDLRNKVKEWKMKYPSDCKIHFINSGVLVGLNKVKIAFTTEELAILFKLSFS